MFDVAGAGGAIIFMVATVGQIIVSAYTAGYASHCFLVVLEETATGQDEVVWPDEPLVDWLWKLVYLAWLVAFWVLPAWLLVGVIGPALLESTGLPFWVLVLGAVWMLFPISLLSSLSAQSLWVVVRMEILRRLARHLPALLWFYLITGALLMGWVWLFYLALAGRLLLLPLAAMVGAAVFLIDARLLGRLCWLLHYRPKSKRRRPKRKAIPSGERALSIEDPWAVPPEEEKPLATQPVPNPIAPLYPREVPSGVDEPPEEETYLPTPPKPYGLMKEDSPLPPPAVVRRDPEVEPIDLQAIPEDGAAPGPKDHPLAPLTQVSDFEARLAAHDAPPPPPARPLWSGVYQFPWYPQTLGAWVWLSAGSLVSGLFLKVQIAFWPG